MTDDIEAIRTAIERLLARADELGLSDAAIHLDAAARALGGDPKFEPGDMLGD